jgi:hypothetical protein
MRSRSPSKFVGAPVEVVAGVAAHPVPVHGMARDRCFKALPLFGMHSSPAYGRRSANHLVINPRALCRARGRRVGGPTHGEVSRDLMHFTMWSGA